VRNGPLEGSQLLELWQRSQTELWGTGPWRALNYLSCDKDHRHSCEERAPGGLSITWAVTKITDIAVRNGPLDGCQLLERGGGSVCLSRSCIVLKRQKISTQFLSNTTAPCLSQIVLTFGLHRSTLTPNSAQSEPLPVDLIWGLMHTSNVAFHQITLALVISCY